MPDDPLPKDEAPGSASSEPPIERLTRREVEILNLLDRGLSAPEMAEQLTLAVSSVKWYLQQIYGKLGVNNRQQALARARALGWLGTPEPATVPAAPAAPASAPSGTVTFLFTDIEGSTRLLEQLREQYAGVLEQHHDLLRAAVAAHHGHEVDTQGDAFFVAFPRARDAIECVAAAQRALAAHAWPSGAVVRVRMGLHTGEPIVGRTGYIGMDVHRAARIAAAGHGGQVLLSQATRELIAQDLPAGCSVRPLGEHKLKDIRFPQALYQLDIDGLAGEFPSLKTGLAEEAPPTPGEPPYQGLQFFDEADSAHFFGREALTGRLVERVCAERFLAVVGASGSGKSSLVRAGLVPALKRGGRVGAADQPRCPETAWQVHIVTPTAHPLEALASSLTRQAASVTAAATLMDDLRRDGRSLHLFVQRLRPAWQTAATRLLIVVDQFEELFTLCHDEAERRALVDNLLTAVTAEGGATSVVLTLRADFYEHLAPYPALSEHVAGRQEYIGAMNAAELRQAIEAPAAQGGWEFSPGLVDLLLHDVGASEDRQPEPGALPLLSHALLETWKRRRGTLLNLRAYSESGGVRGAIARTAEGVFSRELTPSQQVIARGIFLRLTEPGEGTQDTRRLASYAELLPPGNSAEVEEVLARLAAARLITTGERTVEVAHEALIREWPQLRQWLNEDREGLRLHRHLTGAAQAWERLNRDPGELYRGARLAQTVEWAAGHAAALNAIEQEFLDTSQGAADREQAEREAQHQRELDAARQIADAAQKLAEADRRQAEVQTRTSARLRQRALYLVGALALAVVAAVAAGVLGRQAQQQADISLARELVQVGTGQLSHDPELSILLALESIRISPSTAAETVIHNGIYELHRRERVVPHTDAVLGLAVSPDGARLASFSDDGTIKVWAVAGPHIEGEAPLLVISNTLDYRGRRDGSNFSIAFSPDGTRLVAERAEATAGVWDARTGELLLTLAGHDASVYSVAYSPDGSLIATASGDGTARLWDSATGAQLLVLEGHEGGLQTALFNPDGTRLVTASNDDGTVRLWDLGGSPGQPTAVQVGLVRDVNGVGSAPAVFSPDGTRLAIGSFGRAGIWEVAALLGGGVPSAPLIFGAAADKLLLFTPDGQRLITGGSGNPLKVWNAANAEELLELRPTGETVASGAIAPDGQTLYHASVVGDFMSWDISRPGNPEWLELTGTPHAFTPQGELLVVDYTATAFSLARWSIDGKRAQPTHSLLFEDPSSYFYAVSPDSARFATMGDEGTRVWDTQTGELLATLPTNNTYITWGVGFSPDGRRLATAHELTSQGGGSFQIWDIASGQRLLDIADHEFRVNATAFSPDGKLIATASRDFTSRIYNAETGQLVHVLEGHTGSVFGVIFTPDSRYLITTSGTGDGSIRIWDVATGQTVRTLLNPDVTGFFNPAISADGTILAADNGGEVPFQTYLWDIATGQPILSLPGIGPVFSHDGLQLMTYDGRVNRAYGFYLDREALMQEARAQLTRGLTVEECQAYLHVEVCP